MIRPPLRARLRIAWCAFRHFPAWKVVTFRGFDERWSFVIRIECEFCGTLFEERYLRAEEERRPVPRHRFELRPKGKP